MERHFVLTLKELHDYLNEFLSMSAVADYGPNGLQVEGKREVKSVATAVSASLKTIEMAVSKGIDALIVHHGIFWNRDSYVIEGTKRKKLELLLRNGMSLFAYHLPLDIHPEIGNNWKAAKEMGWFDLQPFGILNGVFIGVKGKILPITKEELKAQLEAYYNHPAAIAYGGPDMIESVALISGGAHKSILEAAQENINAYITGSFDEPVWHQAIEEKIHFYALGHSATERVGPIALANHLCRALPIPCSFIDIENPF